MCGGLVKHQATPCQQRSPSHVGGLGKHQVTPCQQRSLSHVGGLGKSLSHVGGLGKHQDTPCQQKKPLACRRTGPFQGPPYRKKFCLQFDCRRSIDCTMCLCHPGTANTPPQTSPLAPPPKQRTPHYKRLGIIADSTALSKRGSGPHTTRD